ncbi:hypothetical protein CDD83_9135 [Cordyceps sp. RAO-2017]|nr:hypothetical protein CDD83_9135 [Cordyceps sp. RAO-2017]
MSCCEENPRRGARAVVRPRLRDRSTRSQAHPAPTPSIPGGSAVGDTPESGRPTGHREPRAHPPSSPRASVAARPTHRGANRSAPALAWPTARAVRRDSYLVRLYRSRVQAVPRLVLPRRGSESRLDVRSQFGEGRARRDARDGLAGCEGRRRAAPRDVAMLRPCPSPMAGWHAARRRRLIPAPRPPRRGVAGRCR